MTIDPSTLQQVIRTLRYWQNKKLAFDAGSFVNFTGERDRARELNAAESLLLAIDCDELEALLVESKPTREETEQTKG